MTKKATGNKPVAFGPRTANKLVDLLNVREQQQRLGSGTKSKPSPIKHNLVKARNDVGSNLTRGSVVDVGDTILTGLSVFDPHHLWHEGNEQAGGHYGVFRTDVPDGEIAECQLTGVCIARVNVTDAGHRFAVPTDGQTYFTSATEGEIQILDAPTGDPGVRECIVVLRCGAGGEEPIRFELTEALALGDEAEAEQLLWNGSAYVKQGTTFTVRDFTARGWKGEVGYWGWCIKKTDRDTVEGQDEYDIIWMEMQARWIAFTLTEDMTLTSGEASASATVQAFWHTRDPASGSPYEVEVHDHPEGMFNRAKSGAKGIAVYDEKRGFYVAIECQTQAGWIRGTLSADMSGGSATVTVTGYGGAQQDVQSPGSGLSVHDPQGLFPRALSGAKFHAIYNAVDDKYNLVSCDQASVHITGYLAATLEETDASFSSSSFSAIDPAPFSQSPTGTLTIYNKFSYEASSGATYYARWNESNDHWELYQVECG